MITTQETVTASLERGGGILVTRLQYLGDVVLTLPVVHNLKELYPEAEIDYLAKGPGADLLAGDPSIDQVHRVPDGGLGNTWRLVRDLRRRRYALAIDLLANPRSAMLTWLSGARARVGEARRVRRHFYTHQISVPRHIREATGFHLHHLHALGIPATDRKPSLIIRDDERDWADSYLSSLLQRRTGEPGLTIGIHPGGKWEVKRWPAAYFARLAAALSRNLGARICVIAGPGEERHARDLENHLDCAAVFVPELPVRRAAAFISRLDCMIVGDGGIMHVAVAVDTPTVGIFGSSEPDIWFPYERFGPFYPAVYPIECRPCHSHTCEHLSCLRELSVETVERLAEKAIALRAG
jgi:lipopolysaccharide heptosyltransferase II